MATSGLELRLERVAARVKLKALADAMGRHRATIANYETRDVVSAEVAAEYRAALATFSEVATPEQVA